MVPFPTILPSESFGWKDFFDSLPSPFQGEGGTAQP